MARTEPVPKKGGLKGHNLPRPCSCWGTVPSVPAKAPESSEGHWQCRTRTRTCTLPLGTCSKLVLISSTWGSTALFQRPFHLHTPHPGCHHSKPSPQEVVAFPNVKDSSLPLESNLISTVYRTLLPTLRKPPYLPVAQRARFQSVSHSTRVGMWV